MTIPNIFEFKTNLEITGSFGYEFTQEVSEFFRVRVSAKRLSKTAREKNYD